MFQFGADSQDKAVKKKPRTFYFSLWRERKGQERYELFLKFKIEESALHRDARQFQTIAF
jgi:hypothetical protein